MCLLNFDILKLFLNSLYAIMFQCILCGLFKLKNHQYPIVYKPNAAKAGHVIYMQPAHPQTQPQPHWGWDKMDVILQTTFSNPFFVNENHSNSTEAYLGHARKIFSNTGSVIANTDLVITNTDLVITNTDPVIANTDLVITNTDPVITNTDPVIA